MSLVMALTVSVALLTAPGEGEDAQGRAKELARSGQELFKKRKFKEAAEKFEEALQLLPRPALHFNLARCREALGEVPAAMREYREYLRLTPDASDRAVVNESLSALEARLAAKGLRQLAVVTEPVLASVEIDGVAQGTAPVYIELPPGAHVVVVKAEGYEPAERHMQIDRPRAPTLTVTLLAKPPPVAVRAEPVERAVTLVPAEPPPPAPPVLVAPPVEKPRQRVVTWVLGGTALAAVGVAAGFGLAANGASAELKDTLNTREGADALVARTQSFATVANVSWISAGVAAVASLILFFVEGAQ